MDIGSSHDDASMWRQGKFECEEMFHTKHEVQQLHLSDGYLVVAQSGGVSVWKLSRVGYHKQVSFRSRFDDRVVLAVYLHDALLYCLCEDGTLFVFHWQNESCLFQQNVITKYLNQYHPSHLTASKSHRRFVATAVFIDEKRCVLHTATHLFLIHINIFKPLRSNALQCRTTSTLISDRLDAWNFSIAANEDCVCYVAADHTIQKWVLPTDTITSFHELITRSHDVVCFGLYDDRLLLCRTTQVELWSIRGGASCAHIIEFNSVLRSLIAPKSFIGSYMRENLMISSHLAQPATASPTTTTTTTTTSAATSTLRRMSSKELASSSRPAGVLVLWNGKHFLRTIHTPHIVCDHVVFVHPNLLAFSGPTVDGSGFQVNLCRFTDENL